MRSALGIILVSAVATIEVVAHYWTRANVPADVDWVHAADLVRSDWQEGDLIVAAPMWVDPVMREHLGDRMTLADAGRSDLSRYARIWVVSIRGADAPEAPSSRPETSERFGEVTVRRWPLRPTSAYDFVEGFYDDATVTQMRNGEPRPCLRQRHSAFAGGLGWGAAQAADRFHCGGNTWVGVTVTETLELEPRRCIFQAPSGSEPLRVTFPNVPLGGELVIYGGLDYHNERRRDRIPVSIAVSVDGRAVLSGTHEGGDGWLTFTAPTCSRDTPCNAHGEVRVDVSAANPWGRAFCWAGGVRRP